VAVDSSVVLDLLVASDDAHAARAEYLLAGHRERHQILLPAIVIAEIAGAGDVRGHHLTTAVREERVVKALDWVRASNFIVAELSERTARRAAELAVAHQLKGPDASILATAEQWSCTQLYTRDAGLLKCDGQLGFKIALPDEPPPPNEPEPDLFSTAAE
jgi:predicted nucleic acid-binding protein